MKHVNTGWEYVTEPFPQFRAELCFGRNKRDKAFIPVRGIVPDEFNTLPDGMFSVIKTRAKGTIMIVDQEDHSNRCLAMLHRSGGFRGGVNLVSAPEGSVIAHAQAGNACESGIMICAILNTGEKIVISSYGRYGTSVLEYTWDGEELRTRDFTGAEWKARSDLSKADDEDGDYDRL